MNKPVAQRLRVFLCHVSEDKRAIRNLYEKLSTQDWIKPWLDEKELLPGQDWKVEIEEALNTSDAVIVMLSSHSVSKEGFVQRELRYALDKALEKPSRTIFILPVRLDECERPRELQQFHTIDYFPAQRRDAAFGTLLESLRRRAESLNIPTKISRTTPPPASPSISQAPAAQRKGASAQKQGSLEGTVQDFRESQDFERRLNFFDSSVYQVPIIVRSFSLDQGVDQHGRELPLISVVMRGESYSHHMKDGDQLRLFEKTWEPGKTIRTNHVFDVNRQVEIVAESSRKSETRRQVVIGLVLLIVFLVVALYVFPMMAGIR